MSGTVEVNVSASDDEGDAISYDYYWGDGSSTLNASSTEQHTYSNAGKYAIRVVAQDTFGDTDEDYKVTSVDSVNISTKDSGSWKAPKNVWVNDGGTWKKAKEVYVNDGGTWKKALNVANEQYALLYNYSFEDMSKWEILADGSRVFQSTASGNPDGSNVLESSGPLVANPYARSVIFESGSQISKLSYAFKSLNEPSEIDMAVLLKNSNGSYECGFRTYNKEIFTVVGKNANDEFDDISVFSNWYDIRFTFDWGNTEVNIDVVNLSNGTTEFTYTTPLENGTDISQIELWGGEPSGASGWDSSGEAYGYFDHFRVFVE